jgi:hypothetical protein
MKHLLLAIIFVFTFYGCGGGGGSSGATVDTSQAKQIGYFLDSVVDGVEYEWENCTNVSASIFNQNGPHITGMENGSGSFYFQSGCTVKFKIGNIYLGDITESSIPPADNDGKRRIYPTNILGLDTTNTSDTRVDNLLRVIQSLDSDSNPLNGITISQTIRNNLSSAQALNLKKYDNITEDSLSRTVSTVDSSKTLISISAARSHFDKTLQTYVNPSLDTTKPATPYLIDNNKQNTTLTQIRTFHTKMKKIRIYGEAGTKILKASNHTGSTTNLSFIDTGLVMNGDWTQEVPLEFDNNNETHFHKFIVLEDTSGKKSDILHLDVIKDFVPPHVQDSKIGEKVFEEQVFFRNINASDSSNIKFYQIVAEVKDDRSLDDEKFQVDSGGNVTFKDAPNFDEQGSQKDFQLVARAIDDVGNMTDVLLKVSIKNLLDNPPILKDGLIEFNTSIYENPAPNSFIADFSLTLEDNLTIAPDNNITISKYFHYTLLSHTNVFDLNLTTGTLTVKDENHSLLDFENYDGTTPHNSTIPVSFMISNGQNNDHLGQDNTPNEDYNTTATYYIEIKNKLDTKPKLETPSSSYTIPEHNLSYNNEGKYYFEDFPFQNITINKDHTDSKYDFNNFPFIFSIHAGNHGTNFGIGNDGRLYLITTHLPGPHDDGVPRVDHAYGSTLDFETLPEYNLTIRASNSFDDNSDGNYIDDNITTHTFDVNLTIKIDNVVDTPPVVIAHNILYTFPESIAANQLVATIDVNGTTNDENTIDGGYIQTYLRDKNVNGKDLEVYKKGDASKDDLTLVPFNININANDNNGTVTTKSQLLDDKFFLEDANGSSHLYTVNFFATNIWWDGSEHTQVDNSNDPKVTPVDFNVTNVIDNPPKLNTPVQSTYFIDENTTINTILTPKPVRVADTNTTLYDEKNVTSYVLVNPNNEDRFDINTTSGDIFIKNPLNWEDNTTFTIEYKAVNTWWDGTEHDSIDTRSITINIDNIIEKAPQFYVPTILNVHENWDLNDLIFTVETNSTKVDEQNITSYSLTGDGGKFSININPLFDNNGLPYAELKIASDLDWENNNSYLLTVGATNIEGNTTEHNVSINIIDNIDKNLPFLVIAIEYQDINLTMSEADLENLFFSASGGEPFLDDYFKRISKEKFSIEKAKETYGINDNGIIMIKLNDRNHTGSATQLKTNIKDALTLANADINFSNFDTYTDFNTSAPDGNITYKELQLIFIIAGGDKAYDKYDSSYNADANKSITAISGNFYTDGIVLDSKKIKTQYSVVGEMIGSKTGTIGLIAKLIGENLLGFQEGGSNYEFKKLGLMDEGFLGSENNKTVGYKPVHPSIYNKTKQGWIHPKTLNTGFNDNITFYNTHDNNKKFNAIRINESDDIYYLIENRDITTNGAEINYDNGLSDLINSFKGGLIIWKIDKLNNQVELVEIDNSPFNVFDTSNTVGDLPNTLPFEFSDIGTIDGKVDSDGTKKYEIGIEVK